MRNLFSTLTAVCLFTAPTLAAISYTTEDNQKLQELLGGHRVTCTSIKPEITPTLNYEILNPKVTTNSSQTQLSLHTKIVYYRCLKDSADEATFSVVDPSLPYQYDVEQFDGSTTTIKVNSQKYRFTAHPFGVSPKMGKGVIGRSETDGLIHHLHFDLPLAKLLSARQKSLLDGGQEIPVTVRVESALSTDYRIGAQTKGNTGFAPATSMVWELTVKKKHGSVKAKLVKVHSTLL